MSVRNKQVWWGSVGCLLVYAVTVVFTSVVLAVKDGGKVPPNLSVAGIMIGGLPYREAYDRLAAQLPRRVGKDVVFRAEGAACSLPLSDCHISVDIGGSLQNCFDGGRAGIGGLAFHSVIRGRTRDFPVVFQWDSSELERAIERIRPQLELPPQDARVILRDDCLEYIPHRVGRRIDEKKTIFGWEQGLRRGIPGPVEVVFNDIHPLVKVEDIKAVRDVLGVYVTTFNPAQKARTNNLRLAARKIDGTVVMPGQVFSLDATVGPRREDDGYCKAPVFIHGQLVEAVGGGVCQVATTLYNAVLQAGLEVLERRPHSQPITYVPLGQDATIYGNLYDLKFRNNTKAPVLIAMSASSNKLVARIFGCQTDPGRTIRLVTERQEVQPRVVIRNDPKLAAGTRIIKERGRKGYRVKTYRIVSENGRDIEKTLLSEDYYRPKDTVIIVGPNQSGQSK